MSTGRMDELKQELQNEAHGWAVLYPGCFYGPRQNKELCLSLSDLLHWNHSTWCQKSCGTKDLWSSGRKSAKCSNDDMIRQSTKCQGSVPNQMFDDVKWIVCYLKGIMNLARKHESLESGTGVSQMLPGDQDDCCLTTGHILLLSERWGYTSG